SRRRHTRSKRDWSSDVCSSDLREGCLWQEEEAAEVAAVVAAVASVGLVVAVVAVVLVDAVADHSVVVVAEALGVVAVLGAAEVKSGRASCRGGGGGAVGDGGAW